MKNLNFEKIVIGFLFLLTIILTLYPFFCIGFTTADDLEYYMTARVGDFWSNAQIYAQSAGRFYFLITKPFYHIPYIIDDFYCTKIIQYAFVLLSFILFMCVVRKITKDTAFSVFTLLLLFACLAIMPNEVAIIAYPFFFSFSFSLFLLSFLIYIKYKESQENKFLILAVLLYTCSLLFYENYLVYLCFYLIYIFAINIKKSGYKKIWKQDFVFKEILPFVVVAVLYILIYFIYRKNLPQDSLYGGSSFASNFSLKHFFEILWNYNRAAIPTQMYYFEQGEIITNSDLLRGHIDSFIYLIKHMPIIVIANVLVQMFIGAFLMTKIDTTRFSWRNIFVGIAVCLLFAFASHFLLALSEKYNMEYYSKRGYVTTYFSYFAVVFLSAIIFIGLLKAMSKNIILKYIAFTIILFSIGYISFITHYANIYISKDWEKGQSRFDAMEELIRDGAFDELTAEDVVYAGELYKTQSLNRAVYAQGFDWSSFINVKSKNNTVRLLKSSNTFNKNTGRDYYYFSCKEYEKSNQLLFSLSKMSKYQLLDTAKVSQDVLCDFSKIYLYSPLKEFLFAFQSDTSGIVVKDYTDTISISKGYNVIQVKNTMSVNSKITSFVLQGNALLPNSFFVSGNVSPK